jgi:hypothetical protein
MPYNHVFKPTAGKGTRFNQSVSASGGLARRWASMNHRSWLLPALFALVGVAAASPPFPQCDATLRPTTTVPPELPRILHNEFEGTIQVEVVVLPTGEVSAVRAVSSSIRPIGRARGEPVGYAEATVAAVREWRFPPQPYACQHMVPVSIEFLDHVAD